MTGVQTCALPICLPNEIQSNPAVIKAYLGSDYEKMVSDSTEGSSGAKEGGAE